MKDSTVAGWFLMESKVFLMKNILCLPADGSTHAIGIIWHALYVGWREKKMKTQKKGKEIMKTQNIYPLMADAVLLGIDILLVIDIVTRS